jgi:DNA-binding beta-propeller fold protein YncE
LNLRLNLRPYPVSRRTFLAGLSTLAACSRKRAPRYQAWLFVASAAERAVVVGDLSSFRRSGSIPLGAVPNQVLSVRHKLFAACPESRQIVQINPTERTIVGKIDVTGQIAGVCLTTDGNYLVVATTQPDALLLIDTANNHLVHRTPLPAAPRAVAASGAQAAVLLEANATLLARVSVPDGALLGVSAIDAGNVTALDYRKDGETIFTAAPDAMQLVSLSAASGAVLARLPVPIRPARFCVNGDGGQVFITGADREPQLVIFSPYQNQVYQTLYAGHALYGMAVAPVLDLLFLSNPDAGDVTIFDIYKGRVVSSIRTGGKPGEILIAPSSGPEEYAFVVDVDTGDVSVIHIPVVLHKPGDAFIAEPPKPIFAVFHGGADPQSAVIVPYSS